MTSISSVESALKARIDNANKELVAVCEAKPKNEVKAMVWATQSNAYEEALSYIQQLKQSVEAKRDEIEGLWIENNYPASLKTSYFRALKDVLKLIDEIIGHNVAVRDEAIDKPADDSAHRLKDEIIGEGK